MSPCLSMAIVMFSGLVCVGRLVAFGRSNCTCWMMTRIVMMKMIRSTNITSTRGVTLMSDIASPSSPLVVIAIGRRSSASGRRRGLADRCSRPLVHAQTHLRPRDQIGMQFMGEVADSLLDALIATQQNVVAQHRGYRDRETDGGHDQRFTDGSCHLVDRGLSGHADGDQRVINADDRTEQSDEGRRGPDGREHR